MLMFDPQQWLLRSFNHKYDYLVACMHVHVQHDPLVISSTSAMSFLGAADEFVDDTGQGQGLHIIYHCCQEICFCQNMHILRNLNKTNSRTCEEHVII